MASIAYRPITSVDEIKQVVKLQESVWSYETITSLAQLVAAVHHGGSVIGAYDEESLIGFCYGFPGFKDGMTYLVSHMMAVDSRYRDKGIGYELKKAQRLWTLECGIKKIVWTFDPLETRNAYLNLCKLGGIVGTYIEAFYGELSGELNQGLPTDRFLLEWDLTSERVQQAMHKPMQCADQEKKWKRFNPILSATIDHDMNPVPLEWNPSLLQEPGFLLPVPRTIHQLKKLDMDLARRWRFTIRAICQEALAKGYQGIGLKRTDGPLEYYVFQNRN